MVAASMLSLVIAAGMVAAEVFPDKPAGDVYTTGQDCLVHWTGDTNSTTTWQNMAIELMTGDNFNMVHLTTITTGQDGTKDGSFTHKCPGVAPNAPIYFYQFTSPNIVPEETQWTTRFTIAGEDGHTDPAPNATQPDDKHSPIPWGVGKLLDPSSATPPPDFGNNGSNSTNTTSTSTTSTPTPTANTGVTTAGSSSTDTKSTTTTTTPSSSNTTQIKGSGAAVAAYNLQQSSALLVVLAIMGIAVLL